MLNASFWKQKLAAFRHDPSCNALTSALASTERAVVAASAADRLPLPSGLPVPGREDSSSSSFHHPLCGNSFPLDGLTAEEARGISHAAEPVCSIPSEWDEAQAERARFFTSWRLWRQRAGEADWRQSFLPADATLPDHSAWHHRGIASALAGCQDADGTLRPAFLKLQLGPVQDFIAAAKSVRDLWSGSYLLSWLMAAGLKALSKEVGPDAVIFPSLYQQPLFDLQWRHELWDKVRIGDKSVWESWRYNHREHLLVPNLPNVFLALVPASDAERLGRLVQKAIEEEWGTIAEKCREFCGPLTDTEAERNSSTFTKEERTERFNQQVSQFLQISWVAEPWPETLETALATASRFSADMPMHKAMESIAAVLRATGKIRAEAQPMEGGVPAVEAEHAAELGLAWSAILAFTNWKLDAVRQTRPFKAWGDAAWTASTFHNKDALNGREEAVAGGRTWFSRCERAGGVWPSLFKTDAWVGASTLIKRVWHLAYLKEVHTLKTSSQDFPMPDTRLIAKGMPDNEESPKDISTTAEEQGYFAVLALDGDRIGAWVSGENNPTYRELLAPAATGYFERSGCADFLQQRRLLSPGFHLQFSETLSAFALRVAWRLIHHFKGRLIYAGGDDVLALLPAQNAIQCAKALRLAFQGKSPGVAGIESPRDGFLSVDGVPFAVPGPRADVSVGIAVAHFKHPLQDVVRAAQKAEKNAKSRLGRSAVEIATFKRSGEILEWGCKWEGGGLELFEALRNGLQNETLSGRFPHRVCELLTPYLESPTGIFSHASVDGFPAQKIVEREFSHVLSRQGSREADSSLPELLDNYLVRLSEGQGGTQKARGPVESVIGLCRSVAFVQRNPVHP